MTLSLKNYQLDGAAFLAARRCALLADEMGLGKSAQAIAASQRVNARSILIVCPAALKLNWARELELWYRTPIRVQAVVGVKAVIPEEDSTTASALVINYRLLAVPAIYRQLTRRFFDVGVFDEAHYLKGRESQRTKAVLGRFGIACRATRKWFMTGTPVLNRPSELYPILKAAAPDVLGPYTTYPSYARRFCGGYWDGLQFFDKGATNLADLNRRLTKDFMLRRLKRDVLPELPPRAYQILPAAAPDAQTRDNLAIEFTFAQGELKKSDLFFTGSDLALLRHELALAKLPAAVQLIKDMFVQSRKLVVFAYHRDVISGLAERLADYNPVIIDGRTSTKAKQANVDGFQKDENTRLLIGQISAAGVGFNLTAASDVLFVESSWVPGEIDQAVDRVHRIGQDMPVNVRFLVFRNSLEENMLQSVVNKKKNIDQIVTSTPIGEQP